MQTLLKLKSPTRNSLRRAVHRQLPLAYPYRKYAIVVAIFLITGYLCSQVTGKFILDEYPESNISTIRTFDESVAILVHSIHTFEDTNKYSYSSTILSLPVIADSFEPQVLFESNAGTNRFMIERLTQFRDRWIWTRSTANAGFQFDSILVTVLNSDFSIEYDLSRILYGLPASYTDLVLDTIYLGIGSTLFPDSLAEVRCGSMGASSDSIRMFKHSPPPAISFVTSITRDEARKRYIVFHYGGISHLDDTLGLISRYPGNLIGTANHGNVLVSNNYYYSFGASAFQGGPELRDLVFQSYDSSMIVAHSDTFGRLGEDDYPFIFNSLDTLNGNFYFGGMMAGPTNFTNLDTTSFFVAKYDHEMNEVWYRTFGDDACYLINGIEVLQDGRCMLYGWKTEGEDRVRFPYLLILDGNGNPTSVAPDVPTIDNYDVFPNPFTDYIEILPSEGYKSIKVRLFDVNGRMIHAPEVICPCRLKLDHLVAGVYFYQILNENAVVKSGKVVKM